MINKKFISKNCMTKTGNLNNRVAMKSWWINKGFKDELEFLDLYMERNGISTITEALYLIANSMDSHSGCRVCGKETTFVNYSSGYRDYCGTFCASQSNERNEKIQKNRNNDKAVEAMKSTNMKKYGVPHYYQTDEFKEKTKKTKIQRYGNANYCNREKIKETVLDRYGTNHYFTSDSWKKEFERRMSDRGGSFKVSEDSLELLNDLDYLKKLNETMNAIDIADEIGVTYKTLTDRYGRDAFIKHPTKKQRLQSKLFDSIKSFYEGEIRFNDNFAIYPKEIDIYLPNAKLGIELNGIYWHSVSDTIINKSHLNKTDICNENGIDLIQITDFEYKEKEDIILSLIKSKLGIFDHKVRASECDIGVVNKDDCRAFLTNNHIQGHVHSKVNLGLYYKNELVYLITLDKPRFDKTCDYEIIRLCGKIGYQVYGGASRLLKFFISDYNPLKIITYSSIDKFNGKVYEKLGFEFVGSSEPNYMYYKGGKILSRYAAQKHKLKALLENYDSKKTEKQNMLDNGFLIYYDCGNRKFVKRIENE